MRPKSDLFDLIQSLSTLEVANFRKEILKRKGTHTYLKVFDAIREMEVYDEYQLKKTFRGEKTLNNFSVAKANLYDKILEVQCGMPQHQNLETEFDQYRQQITILTRKGLFKQALERVHKSSRIAEKLEAFSRLTELYDYERELSRSYFPPAEFLSITQNIRKKMREVLEVEQNLKEYQDLFDKVLIAQRMSESMRATLISTVISHKNMQDESECKSSSASILFYRIWKLVYDVQRKEDGWKFFSVKILSVLESQTHFLAAPSHFIVYLDTVTDFGLRCIRRREYDDAELALRKLRKLRKTLRSGDSEAMIHLRFWRIRLHHGLQTLIWEQTELALRRLSEGVRKYRNKISKVEEVEVSFLITIAYITFGQEKEALEWVNQIKNENYTSNRPDLHLFSWLLFLVVQYNLRNFEEIEKNLEKTREYLKSHRAYGTLEESLLDFFAITMHAMDPYEIQTALDNLKIKIKKFTESVTTFRLEDYFDLLAWIDSQKNRKSLREVLKAKQKKVEAGTLR